MAYHIASTTGSTVTVRNSHRCSTAMNVYSVHEKGMIRGHGAAEKLHRQSGRVGGRTLFQPLRYTQQSQGEPSKWISQPQGVRVSTADSGAALSEKEWGCQEHPWGFFPESPEMKQPTPSSCLFRSLTWRRSRWAIFPNCGGERIKGLSYLGHHRLELLMGNKAGGIKRTQKSGCCTWKTLCGTVEFTFLLTACAHFFLTRWVFVTIRYVLFSQLIDLLKKKKNTSFCGWPALTC